MKKNSKMAWTIYIGLSGLLITVLSIGIPYVYGVGSGQAGLKAADVALGEADKVIKKDATELKEEGCLPARDWKENKGVFKNKLENIEKDMAQQTQHIQNMSREQRAFTKEVLRRLPK